MIHRSPFPDVDVPEVPLPTFVLRRCAELGDKPALVDGPSGRTITYAQLASSVSSFAGGLAARGFGPGSVLALMAPNLPEYAVAFHGVATAGGTVTTINPTYTEREVHHQLTDAGATILVTVGPFAELAVAAAAGTGVTDVYVLGETDVAGVRPVTDLFGPPLDQVAVRPDDVVALPYSSGTTGLAKGVMLTHRNLVANVVQILAVGELEQDEVLVAALPLFHIYGMSVLMNTALAGGMTVVTVPRFDLEQYLELNQRYRATRAYVAPPIVLALAKHPLVDRYDLSSWKQVTSGAAPLSAELAEEASARLGCEVSQGYGMTEASPVTHLTPMGRAKPGSVGFAAPNTETLVVDPVSGEAVGDGEDGEIRIRGPQVMKGYLNNPAATAATLDADGWLHTGDIGHVDADGYLFVVDRLKELIKVKGFQVPPAELEGLLLTHPAVADAAVVGVPDPDAGELPIGYVVLKPGQSATPDELRAFVADRVAHYKRLAEVHLVDAVPKSASGKILRRVLKDGAGGT